MVPPPHNPKGSLLALASSEQAAIRCRTSLREDTDEIIRLSHNSCVRLFCVNLLLDVILPRTLTYPSTSNQHQVTRSSDRSCSRSNIDPNSPEKPCYLWMTGSRFRPAQICQHWPPWLTTMTPITRTCPNL